MIDLSTIPLRLAEPEVQDFGGVLTPPLGGPVQRIDRVGTRWTIAFETPLLDADPALRIWSTRLARAKKEGALLWIPEPDLPVLAYGAPAVWTGVVAGSTVELGGMIGGVTIVEGKWLSFVASGRRYLHRVTADALVTSAGRVVLTLDPMLRASLGAGVTAELAVPKMQGTVVGRVGWPIDVSRAGALSFTVAEDE